MVVVVGACCCWCWSNSGHLIVTAAINLLTEAPSDNDPADSSSVDWDTGRKLPDCGTSSPESRGFEIQHRKQGLQGISSVPAKQKIVPECREKWSGQDNRDTKSNRCANRQVPPMFPVIVLVLVWIGFKRTPVPLTQSPVNGLGRVNMMS